MLRKVKQLLSNFEAEKWENLSNLRLAKKSVAYKKNSSVGFRVLDLGYLRVLENMSVLRPKPTHSIFIYI